MSHKIEGLDNLPSDKQVAVLASLLKDKIKEVNHLYWKDNDPCIRVFFFPDKQAVYGLYTNMNGENRINLLAQPFKTEN